MLGLICDRVTPIAVEKPVKTTGKGPPGQPPYTPPPPPKAISLGAKPSAGAVAAVPTFAPRQAIQGVWTTQTDKGARYRILLNAVNSGYGPNGIEIPIQVTGNITNIDGNTQLDGGIQGVIQINSRTLIFNYALKNGETGNGTVHIVDANGSDDHEVFALEPNSGVITGYAWSPDGTRLAVTTQAGLWVVDATGINPAAEVTSGVDCQVIAWLQASR